MARIRGNRIRRSRVQPSSLLSISNSGPPRMEAKRESSSHENDDHICPPPLASVECPLYIQFNNLYSISQNYARQIVHLREQKSIIDKRIGELGKLVYEGSASSED